jgi:hypothetical protein
MYIPNLNSYFIHIPKCGGTSIELFFFKMHGLDLPDRDLGRHLNGKPDGKKFNWGWRVPGVRYETQHITAYHCKKYDVEDFKKSTYKFTFVRNPWERFVSEVFWKRQRMNMNISFEKQLQMHATEVNESIDIAQPHNAPMWKYVYDENNNLLVDDIFKLEEMDKAEKILSEKFGRKISFGHVNKTDKKDYREYLSPEIRKQLYPLIKKDLEVFGYE